MRNYRHLVTRTVPVSKDRGKNQMTNILKSSSRHNIHCGGWTVTNTEICKGINENNIGVKSSFYCMFVMRKEELTDGTAIFMSVCFHCSLLFSVLILTHAKVIWGLVHTYTGIFGNRVFPSFSSKKEIPSTQARFKKNLHPNDNTKTQWKRCQEHARTRAVI